MKINDTTSAAAPVQTIYVGEELTLCPSCGTRTELLAMLAHARREGCASCGQQYDVVDDEEG